MRFIYLHGFASSPASKKASFFAERFREKECALEVPALDGGDFSGLTITGQLEAVKRIAGDQPSVLLGSSLGAYLAALYAARHAEVSKLILLAPAFRFARRWQEEMPTDLLREWQHTRRLPVHHHGEHRRRFIGYQLIEDGLQYEEFPDFHQPALIFVGSRDTVTPPGLSESFCATHPNARLLVTDSDHELLNVLDLIWTEVEPFLLAP